jgi:homoserine kinase
VSEPRGPEGPPPQGPPTESVSIEETRRRVEGVRIEVPGSSANLGPGFDALAVAVRLYLRVTVRRVLDGPRNELRCSFAGVALQGDNYVARSVITLAQREGLDYPALDVDVDSEIPMQGGLGSSAAATVAGLMLYERLAGPRDRDLLAEGTRFEGHPDNVAASLLGGLTAACTTEDGRAVAVSTPWPGEVRLVAVTPEVRVKTPEARRVLPDSYTRADAVFNLQRATLLMAAIHGGRPELLRDALADRWHQPYRAPLVPGLTEALALRIPGLLGVCLSGSGPTVVALCSGDTSPVETALTDVYARLGLPCRVRTLAAHNGPPNVFPPDASRRSLS